MTLIRNQTSRLIGGLTTKLIDIPGILTNPITAGRALQVASKQDGKTESQLVTVDGGNNLSSWLDYSGNGRDIPQGTGSKQPVYTLNAFNTHPGIVFDGDDFLRNISFPNFSTITMFVVAELDAGDARQSLVEVSRGTSNTGALFLIFDGDTFFRINGIGNDVGFTDPLPSKHIFTGTGDGTNIKLYADGVLKGTDTIATLAGTQNQLDVGDLASGGEFPLIGTIAEIIIYDRALSDPEREAVEQYLSPKWTVPLLI